MIMISAVTFFTSKHTQPHAAIESTHTHSYRQSNDETALQKRKKTEKIVAETMSIVPRCNSNNQMVFGNFLPVRIHHFVCGFRFDCCDSVMKFEKKISSSSLFIGQSVGSIWSNRT